MGLPVSVLDDVTARELMEWAAYEQVYGPLLLHERIDAGFAMLATVIARANGAKRAKQRDFMPEWFRELTADHDVARTFERMLRDASANNQHADR